MKKRMSKHKKGWQTSKGNYLAAKGGILVWDQKSVTEMQKFWRGTGGAEYDIPEPNSSLQITDSKETAWKRWYTEDSRLPIKQGNVGEFGCDGQLICFAPSVSDFHGLGKR